MTYATTFSGIGGWELGLNACGWQLLWQCECEPYCRALLAERFGVPIYPDIRTLADEQPPAVDCLVGSPPCQPFSVAGAQRGTRDERHLYPSFLRAVRVLAPRWVLMEQVPAILSLDGGRAFGQYIGGLAALGYDLVWHCLPACAVGAPHRRDRLWIVAHARHKTGSTEQRQQRNVATEITGRMCETDVADAQRAQRRPKHQACGQVQRSNCLFTRQESAGWIGGSGEGISDDAYPNRHDRHGRSGYVQVGRCGREKSFEAGFLFGGDQWLTEPNVGRVAHGVPARVDRLRGLGNAVVPQIPYLLGQAINAVEGSDVE